jgi:glyoxylase-like metal-dependent hydrolase (beta-lactamase superfamily II)
MKAIAAALLLAAASCALAQDFSKVEVQATKLNDTTYMLTGAGGNMGLSVGEDAVFLIDDQYAPLTDRINAAIAQITPKPVKFVLNTHWHGDHAGGNENLGKAGVLILAHDNVRKRMSSEQFIELMKMTVKPSPKVALPIVTFASSMSFHLNGEEIRALHMPRAHTDGDAIVQFMASDVIHMGDIYFAGMYPFIDTSSGGTPEGLIAACDQALALATDKTKIIPGHGPLSNKAALKAYRDMVATVTARVKEGVAAGKKAEEIAAGGATKDFDEKWGKGFINPAKFVEMLAAGMGKNR